jgi:hypothetical protein
MSGVRMAVGHPLRFSPSGFSQPSQNFPYHYKTGVRETALSSKACFISWKVSVAVLPVLEQNLMFSLCSNLTNCHNDLRDIKSETRLSMNDKREVTDLIKGTL